MIDRLLDLLGRRGPALSAFAYQLTHDSHQAQDLVQEAVTRLLAAEARGSAGRIRSLEPYLRRIMLHAHIDRTTDLAARGEVATEDVWSKQPASGPPFDSAAVDRTVLWAEIGRLPGRQRAVLVLRYYQGSNDAEIAADLKCPPGTIRSLASRALATLRERMLAEGTTTTGEDR